MLMLMHERGWRYEGPYAQAIEKALNFVCFGEPKAQFLQWLPNVRRDEDIFERPCLAHPVYIVYAAVLKNCTKELQRWPEAG